jgi:hypothetical protein
MKRAKCKGPRGIFALIDDPHVVRRILQPSFRFVMSRATRAGTELRS